MAMPALVCSESWSRSSWAKATMTVIIACPSPRRDRCRGGGIDAAAQGAGLDAARFEVIKELGGVGWCG